MAVGADCNGADATTGRARMTGLLLGALLAGLAGSPHCLAMCGGFAASCGRPGRALAAWHAGRLTTYALLGAAAGAAGHALGRLPGPAWLPAAVAATLLAWFALALAGLVPEPRLALPGVGRAGATLAGRNGAGWRYAFGLATGLLPCGLVYGALTVAVAAGTPGWGAAAMLAFGLGTLPALTLLAAGMQRLLARGRWARRLVAAAVFVAGLWAIGAREGLLGTAHRHAAPPGEEHHGH